MARTVASIVTLSRSDYASVKPVALAALADPGLDVRIVAGGSHNLARYGRTIEQLARDGLPVHANADFLREDDDSASDLAAAHARAVAEFVRIFGTQSPDLVFVLGDRWEMLAVAAAASMLQVPIVHHSGGDITQGSADNQTRYALSMLAHLHLVALPEHAERLVRMGEEAWRVQVTGEPALTALQAHAKAVPDVRARLGLAPGEPFALATFHPTSFDPAPPQAQLEGFLAALDQVGGTIVLTAPNPDAASGLFYRRCREFAATRPHVHLHEALGVETYYAAMAEARLMIGNSSSGLWEAPSFRLPVVNLGPRQQGRRHGANVIHSSLAQADVAAALRRATDPAFRASLDGSNPYLQPDTLARIVAAMKPDRPRQDLLAKRFVDPLTFRGR